MDIEPLIGEQRVAVDVQIDQDCVAIAQRIRGRLYLGRNIRQAANQAGERHRGNDVIVVFRVASLQFDSLDLESRVTDAKHRALQMDLAAMLTDLASHGLVD